MRFLLTFALAAVALIAANIPAGATIQIRPGQTINARQPDPQKLYTADVAQDVYGPGGTVLIARGSGAELAVLNGPGGKPVLSLVAVRIHGHRYLVDAKSVEGNLQIPAYTLLTFHVQRPVELR